MKLEYGSPLFTLIWVFGWAIFGVVIWQLRSRKRERMVDRIHRERLAAIEKGLPLPELPAYEDPSGMWRLNPKWALGWGVVSVMAGIGWMVAVTQDWQVGLIGIFLGVGLWLHYWLTRR